MRFMRLRRVVWSAALIELNDLDHRLTSLFCAYAFEPELALLVGSLRLILGVVWNEPSRVELSDLERRGLALSRRETGSLRQFQGTKSKSSSRITPILHSQPGSVQIMSIE